jgi:hypothetical protein
MTCVATKNDGEYHYEAAPVACYGPCHPNPMKSALVCLTTNGILRLLWPQTDGKWYETTSEVESIVSSNDLITHATICAERSMDCPASGALNQAKFHQILKPYLLRLPRQRSNSVLFVSLLNGVRSRTIKQGPGVQSVFIRQSLLLIWL